MEKIYNSQPVTDEKRALKRLTKAKSKARFCIMYMCIFFLFFLFIFFRKYDIQKDGHNRSHHNRRPAKYGDNPFRKGLERGGGLGNTHA